MKAKNEIFSRCLWPDSESLTTDPHTTKVIIILRWVGGGFGQIVFVYEIFTLSDSPHVLPDFNYSSSVAAEKD